jgi:hypothetical protein
MPGTARRPGYGVRPARDESQEENVRVGRDYLDAMLKKYGNVDYALAAYNWGPGNVDKWIARGAKPEELPAETREYIPRVRAGLASKDKMPAPKLVQDILGPLTGMIPAAQAREPGIIEDPMQQREQGGVRPVPPVIAGPGSVTPGAEIPKAKTTGQFGAYNVKEDQFPLQSTQEMLARRQQGVGSAEDREAPTTFESKVQQQPSIEPPAEIKAEQIALPKERSIKDEYGDIQEAYKQAGVDVDMYKNMMQELKDKKAGLAQRKEQALGSALMAFGLGLSGARQGQVFQQLSTEGQKALGLYMNNMDRIAENEDKIDMMNRQIAMAENNFKRTGAESALSQVRQRRERIDQIEAKNAELRQRAAEHQATVAANVYHTKVWAQVSGENTAAQVAAKLAAAQAQAARAGALTQKQQFDIEQQLRLELEPKLRDKYKNFGSEEQINKKVNDELRKQISQRIAEITSRPAGYGGSPPPQDMFADWTVEGM